MTGGWPADAPRPFGGPSARGGPRPAAGDVVVVVPAYDEEREIGAVVRGLRALDPAFSERGCNLTILVVDDGSRDATAREAREAGADRIVTHRTNRGLGATVRTGLAAARASGAAMAAKFDADGQHDPSDLLAMADLILDGQADIVYGDRTGGMRYRMPIVRRAGNAVFTRLMRWLTGWPLRDSQPGVFVIGREYIESFYLPGDYNYTQQLLLDAYHKGMRFEHAPVTFRPRRSGDSFISMRYPFKVLGQIVLVLVSVRPMKVFAPIGLSFVALAACVAAWQIATWLSGSAPKPIENVNFVLGAGLFGLQTFFFGLLAELIVRRTRA